METKQEAPLRWPESWSRTLINNRAARAAWKKPMSFYRESVIKELEKIGVTAATISYNDAGRAQLDPGVAVWFSLKPTDDFSWQSGLHLDSPVPSLEEIGKAFQQLARKHHPDAVNNGSGGDIQMFHKLNEYRKRARAWVLGSNAPVMGNCIPCDRFTEVRLNLAAIASALRHFRGLELIGIPAILERVMSSSFKAALPAPMPQEVANVTA